MEFSLLTDKESIGQNIIEINKLFNETFSSNRDVNYLDWILLKNPLDISLVLICKDEGRMILARVFWGLGNAHYQCIDTVTHPEYQGKGIFRKSHDYLMGIRPNMRFYNLPNAKSYPVYKKLGWSDSTWSYIKFIFIPSVQSSLPVIEWDTEVLNWRYGPGAKREYFYCRYGDRNIIYFYKNSLFPVILGVTSENLSFLTRRNILFGFSYDAGVVGAPYLLRRSRPVVLRPKAGFNISYYLFDMF